MDIDLILYFAFGILGGVLSGLLGVGGGIIFIPVFDQIFRAHGLEGEELVRYILANSFLAMSFAGFSSSFKHWRMGNFHLKEVLNIAIPATIIGSGLSGIITSSSWYKEVYFKGLFIVVMLFTLWRTLVKTRKDEQVEPIPFIAKNYILIGLATGVISAFSGLGGGIVMIPLLTFIGKIDIKKASAISVSVIPLMIFPFLIIYALKQPLVHLPYNVGYLQIKFILPVVIGVLLGSPLGVRIAHGMKSKQLQLIFAILLIIIVVKYIYEMVAKGLI